MGGQNFFRDITFLPGYGEWNTGILHFSNTNAETSSTTEKVVKTVVVPKEMIRPGTVFRVTMGGSKTATNAAMVVKANINGTAALTLTAPGATAVDWLASMFITVVNHKSQKSLGTLHTSAAANVTDYNAATVDTTGGATFTFTITAGNASDTVDCDFCLVEFAQPSIGAVG